MEKISINGLQNFLRKFKQKFVIKANFLIDEFGKIIASSKDEVEGDEDINDLIKKMVILKKDFKNEIHTKNLNQIILDFSDFQVILSILQNENFILTIKEKEQDLSLILNELKNLTKKINEFYYDRTFLENFHLIKLDENIKKLERYLDIMQPPKFKDIKKLIEYLS